MKSAVIVFPGSNCDRDAHDAIERVTGHAPAMVWHQETELPDGTEFVMVPGGFSYGDYLRCGAMASRSAIIPAPRLHPERDAPILGVCNCFQVLYETGLLPGALMRNAGLASICRDVALKVESTASPFTAEYREGETVTFPVAHHDGNFVADAETLARLEGEGRVAFRYQGSNPNGSMNAIAGVLSENRRVLGLMPHPERAADPALGGADGARLFRSLAGAAVS